MEKAFLVNIVNRRHRREWGAEASSSELRNLAVSSRAEVVGQMVVNNHETRPRTLIGSGKSLEIAERVKDLNADVVIFSSDLSGSQQRNLEEILQIKSIDRTQLILDIFAKRAKSAEGKIQVELAQLNYLLPRLVGRGIILSRLGGGIGTRGPGEQKLEMDRRRLRIRIQRLRTKLDDLARRRQVYRDTRAEQKLPIVALVGYTNAGKSTLFNAFTGSDVLVQDRLFSTLDPTVRRFYLPNRQPVLFVDTVGLLHLLPHHLIEAFKATLEEVRAADLLLHVLDASSPHTDLMEESVRDVLSELGADQKPCVLVLNKIDELGPDALELMKKRFTDALFISSKRRIGLPALVDKIQEAFRSMRSVESFFVNARAMHVLDTIYREGQVIYREDRPDGIVLKVQIRPDLAQSIKLALKGLEC